MAMEEDGGSAVNYLPSPIDLLEYGGADRHHHILVAPFRPASQIM